MYRHTDCDRNLIGKKGVVAVTGAVLFIFVVAHMLGNLKAFLGNNGEGMPEVDVYASFLRTVGAPVIPHGGALWTVRAILLVCVAAHVIAAIQLANANRIARPAPYVRRTYISATPSARSMLWTGIVLFTFVIVHILHFTTGTIDITPILSGQVYRNMYHAFSLWYIVLFYVAGMTFLARHLDHGVWSFFQTLGLDDPNRNCALRRFAIVSAVLLWIGFSAVPVAFWLGMLPVPPDVAPVIPVQSALR